MEIETGKMWILPARKMDRMIAPGERGTKVAEFRGACFDLFSIPVLDAGMWPAEFPLVAECVEKSSGRGANYMEITEVFERSALGRRGDSVPGLNGPSPLGKSNPKRAK
jgi:hypothetical protein